MVLASIGCLAAFAFGSGADGKDDFGGVQAGEVPRGFEAEADVGTGHDDSFIREVARWVGWSDEELGVEESHCL